MDLQNSRFPIGLLTLVALSAAASAQCPEQSFQGLDTASTDNFGRAVDATDLRLIVGAPKDDDLGADSGSAYVFRAEPTGFVQEAKLLGSAVDADDLFGFAVGMTGAGALIGAPFGDGYAADTGVVYGFKRTGQSWTETAILHPGEGDLEDRFGASIAVDGNRAVIGAPRAETTPGGPDGGAIYIFEFGGGSGWQLVQKLVPNDIHSEVRYGYSVALDGDRLVVGAPSDNDGGTNAGAAYVFDNVGGTWFLSIKLIPLDFESFASFGWSVAVDGPEVMVGAPIATGSGARSGAAYVFSDAGGAWSQDAKLYDPSGASVDRFGYSLSMNGDDAVVGAPWSERGGQTVGSAYSCDRDAGQWSLSFVVENPSNNPGNLLFGISAVTRNGIGVVGDFANGQNLVHAYFLDGPDCNANGVPDACDIAAGTSPDNDGNGIPDECDACGWGNGCTSVPNSTGSAALISATGSVSVAANDLVLHAGPVPNQFGLFFYGPSAASAPFGNGFRCVGPPLQRMKVSFGSGNVITKALDITAPPTPSGQITPFTTWFFQCWYRDPAAGGALFNTSDGLKVHFCP